MAGAVWLLPAPVSTGSDTGRSGPTTGAVTALADRSSTAVLDGGAANSESRQALPSAATARRTEPASTISTTYFRPLITRGVETPNERPAPAPRRYFGATVR